MSEPESKSDKPANETKDKDRQERRDVLKTVLVGSGVVASTLVLPTQWTKPVVQAVIGPSPAQAVSPPAGPPTSGPPSVPPTQSPSPPPPP
jgi:hypothetical protein